MAPKIMLSAAEVSADLLGARLATELKGCRLFGMGGEKMRLAGVDVKIDITDKSSIGITEVIKHLPQQLSTLKALKKMLIGEKPDALILIDAQGLNMPLAKFAKSKGIKTIYYIAPQEWLWGTRKGINNVIRTVDLIISIFKKEHEIFKAAGGNSFYFGHPILDTVRSNMSWEDFRKKFGLNAQEKIIALCPGSRSHEIKNFLPILKDVAARIKSAQFVLPISSSKFRSEIEKNIAKLPVRIKIIDGFNYDVLANSDLVIAKSGTVVLESVILNTPVIMFYKLSPLTYWIGKNLLKIKLPYYSMPNILANKLVVPEFVMKDATAENIYNAAMKILADPDKAKSGYSEVRALLGEKGATKKAALKIIEFINSGV